MLSRKAPAVWWGFLCFNSKMLITIFTPTIVVNSFILYYCSITFKIKQMTAEDLIKKQGSVGAAIKYASLRKLGSKSFTATWDKWHKILTNLEEIKTKK